LAEVERQLRAVNLERDALREHIGREEKQLYGGAVKSPKELQNLQAEVDSLKRRLAEQDDVSLNLLLERDEASEARASAGAGLATTETRTAAAQVALVAERHDLAVAIRDLDARRAELAAVLSPAVLAVYDQVRKLKLGKAVAPLAGEDCGGCGMQLPRQLAVDARSEKTLSRCPSCRRILVA
jgi:predicted  nucleic acid-binding Zn-ribbon protein